MKLFLLFWKNELRNVHTFLFLFFYYFFISFFIFGNWEDGG
jgi:hypothetical protein